MATTHWLSKQVLQKNTVDNVRLNSLFIFFFIINCFDRKNATPNVRLMETMFITTLEEGYLGNGLSQKFIMQNLSLSLNILFCYNMIMFVTLLPHNALNSLTKTHNPWHDCQKPAWPAYMRTRLSFGNQSSGLCRYCIVQFL